MSWRQLPNCITVARLLMVPPVVWLIINRRYDAAWWLFVVAGLSDGLDGFLAKRFNWTTELGGFLDPIADKLLMVSSIIALTIQGLVPLWLTAAVVLRDVVIVAGAVAYRVLLGRFTAAPTIISKLNTLVLIMVVVGVLGAQWLNLDPDLWALFGLSLVLTIGSGIDYVLQWGQRARREWATRAR